jgi:hypothetical protein
VPESTYEAPPARIVFGPGATRIRLADEVDRLCLLTGIAGEQWATAAAKVAEDLGIEVVAHVIGPGREHVDLSDDWARTRRRPGRRAASCAHRLLARD